MRSDVAMLFVPGNAERRFRTIDRLGGGAFILDLEDSVPLGEKDGARETVAKLLESRRDKAPLFVRINSTRRGDLEADVAAIVGPGLRGIVLPKVDSADDVRRCDASISACEARRGLGRGAIDLMATIESAAGIDAVKAIARASTRLGRLCFGAADFATDLALDWTGSSELNPTIVHAKVAVVLASRAAGLDRPHDGAYRHIRDLEGLRRETTLARRIGFGGKHVIHPDQIPTVMDAFQPTADERRRATRIVDEFDAALARGEAAIDVEGEMVDYAVASRAREILGASPAARPPPPQE